MVGIMSKPDTRPSSLKHRMMRPCRCCGPTVRSARNGAPICLSRFVRTRRTEVIVTELSIRDADKVCGWVTDHAGCLADAVAVTAVVARDGAVFETRALVASSVDAVATPSE